MLVGGTAPSLAAEATAGVSVSAFVIRTCRVSAGAPASLASALVDCDGPAGYTVLTRPAPKEPREELAADGGLIVATVF